MYLLCTCTNMAKGEEINCPALSASTRRRETWQRTYWHLLQRCSSSENITGNYDGKTKQNRLSAPPLLSAPKRWRENSAVTLRRLLARRSSNRNVAGKSGYKERYIAPPLSAIYTMAGYHRGKASARTEPVQQRPLLRKSDTR